MYNLTSCCISRSVMILGLSMRHSGGVVDRILVVSLVPTHYVPALCPTSSPSVTTRPSPSCPLTVRTTLPPSPLPSPPHHDPSPAASASPSQPGPAHRLPCSTVVCVRTSLPPLPHLCRSSPHSASAPLPSLVAPLPAAPHLPSTSARPSPPHPSPPPRR